MPIIAPCAIWPGLNLSKKLLQKLGFGGNIITLLMAYLPGFECLDFLREDFESSVEIGYIFV